MNQYIITAYDYTDADAFERRMNVRQDHLDNAKKLKENGNFIFAGAPLNEEGKMIGSVMILQFETEESIEAWKQTEPYIIKNIWESVDIKPFKVANIG